MPKHTLIAYVEDVPGVLNRIASLFRRRNFNIDSLTVAPTNDESLSRITVVTRGDEQIIEQITKQLNKLIDVIKVIDFEPESAIEREMVL